MSIIYPGEIPDRVPTTMVISAEWANALRQRAPHIHSTKGNMLAALPSPPIGTIGYVTADGGNNVGWWVYSGTVVGWTRPWDGPWGSPSGTSAARDTSTTDQTGITALADVTALSLTFTAIAGRSYVTEAVLPFVQQLTSAASVTFQLCTSANVVLTQWRRNLAINEVASVHLGPFPEGGLSAGSTTRKIRASTSAGTLSIIPSGAGALAWLDVRDEGPALPPT